MKSRKKELRETMIRDRDQLPETEREEFSRVITNCVLAQEEVKRAKGVFCFVGFGSEPDTQPLIRQLLADGKTVYVPKTEKGNPVMELAQIDSLDALEVDYYGILAPGKTDARRGAHTDVDVVIVPGVVFDKQGNRIGYGAGYYDRFLANDSSLFKLAIGYSMQVIDAVPVDEHDIPVDAFVSEMGIRRFTENKR